MTFFSITILILITLSGQSIAADSTLQKIWAKYEDTEGFKSSFDQIKYLSEIDVVLKSSGVIQVKRPGFLRWEVLKPAYLLVTFDGRNLYIKREDDEKKIKINQNQKKALLQNLNHLKAWIEYDFYFIEKNYKIQKVTKLNYIFVPKTLKSFKEINLHLHSDGLIKSIKFFEPNGDFLKFNFKNTELINAKD